MRLTIKRKLFLAFGLAGLMMAGVASIGYWAQSRAQATQDQIVKTNEVLKDLEHLVAYIGEVTSAQRAYMISGDDNAIAKIPALRDDANTTAQRVQAAIAGDANQTAHFARYEDAIAQRRVFVNKLNSARKDQGAEAAAALFKTGEDDRLLAVILDEFRTMKIAANDQLRAEEAANRAMQREIVWTELIGVLIAAVLLVALAWTLIVSINRNVQVSVEMLAAMARKDLSGPDGQSATDDELAVAIEAINRMKAAMTEAITEVAESSSQVSAAGVEIESSAKQIADTTRREQRNVEQFASSLAEMNAAVKDVAEHAEHASHAASEAVSTATSGREVAHQTREAMNRISDSVKTASRDITTLGEVTGSIGEVVQIIQDIAGQTNLLALNAAIEAARAGEQGKGFAVVAQEVRVLAERTAKSTKEIADKIQSVQEGAGRAVQSMREGETVVNEGVAQFNQVSTALEDIMNRIEAAQQGISMIASAASEQSAATAGLTENIHHISSEVQETAQQVDQTAIACAELANLASNLQQVVDGFQLPTRKASRPRGNLSAPRKYAA